MHPTIPVMLVQKAGSQSPQRSVKGNRLLKGRFTRYDFAAYDKLTTSLRHVLGPFTRERHFHLQN